ncbi:MAG TPA: inositol monophosphatase family protein [Bacteroidota bacterium]|nr:inositol monophosphatase family protein [Bacteroidota bacterium]
MIDLAIEAALEAGRFLKMNIGKVKQIERKYDQETNLVTELDRKSEEIIIRTIKKRYAQHDFLAEESGSHQKESEYRWIIDPLDGTTNFTHGLPIFCVSIGLEVRGELTLGVVYDPNLDELFTVEKGKGAFLNSRPIHVSTTAKLQQSLVVTGFPYDIKENPHNAIQHFSNFLVEAQAVRRLGSAALDLCYVACGRFDGYWEVFLNPWDMAAGVLLLQEAGGKWTDFRGFPTTIYNHNVLVSNGLIHEQMVEVLKRGRDE